MNQDTLFVLLSQTGQLPSDFTVELAYFVPGMGSNLTAEFSPFSVPLDSYFGSHVFLAFMYSSHSGGCAVLLDSVVGPPVLLPSPSSDPQPLAGASAVDVASQLSWTNGFGTTDVEVYLSRNIADVESLNPVCRVLSSAAVDNYLPSSHLLSYRTYYWRVVSRNLNGTMTGPVWSFLTAGGPLAGIYRIGGLNADVSTFTEAISELSSFGVAASTSLLVAPGTYYEAWTIPLIPGASSETPIFFGRANPESTVTIIGGGTATSVVKLNGAAYITIEGIDLRVSGGTTRMGVELSAGSHDNHIRMGTITGTGADVSNSRGVYLAGPGCNDNHFNSLTVRKIARGFHLDSQTSSSNNGNIIENCVTDTVRSGIFISRQDGCHIRRNLLSINAGSFDETDGIIIATTMPQDCVFIYDNRIDRVITSGSYAVGIRIKPDSSSAVVRVYNNTICNFGNTGSSQVRAIYTTSGRCLIESNSILINDVAATGTCYALYIGTIGASGTTTIYNNILVNRENTAAAYGIFVLSGSAIFTSDYNIFHGTGSGYRLGRWGSDQTSLALWKAATHGDAHSFEGDPGFVSATDLHILPSFGLANQNGAVLTGIQQDIDGEPRLYPPDRGADEFAYNAPPADFAVMDLVNLESSYPETTSVSIHVAVQNRGSETQRGVAVRLFCNDSLLDEQRITLTSWQCDTVALNWRTGAGDSLYLLSAACFLDGDANPADDSFSDSVYVVKPPFEGDIQIGGEGSEFEDISSAIDALFERGVTAPVVLELQPGTYTEQLTIPNIPGASEQNRILFRPPQSRGTVTLSADSGSATVVLNGAHHVVFENLRILAPGSTMTCVEITGNADSNEINNCVLQGSSLLMTTACGVRTVGGGNDGNVFRDLSIQDFYYGIRIEGTADSPDRKNRVERCIIHNSRTGIRTDFQDSSIVANNTIYPGYETAGGTCIGLHLNNTQAGHRIVVDANLITGGRGSAVCCGIYSNTNAGSAYITNNVISDWRTNGSGTVYGILIGGGSGFVMFNSLWMNDIPGAGDIIAIADTGSGTALNAVNNVVQISETANRALCYLHLGGAGQSDYTVFHNATGGNPLLVFGRSGVIDYTLLSGWQSLTGRDPHSFCANPGFMDSVSLHIQSHLSTLEGQGLYIADIPKDFDGESRNNPPDIGADEYAFAIVSHNFMTEWIGSPVGQYTSGNSYPVFARVSNVGSQTHADVPVRLFLNDSLIGESAVTLAPWQSDTVVFNWTTPTAELLYGLLETQCYLDGELVPENDSVIANVMIIGPPLAGIYDCGGGNFDFTDPKESLTHLTLRGIADSVVIRVYPGIYSGVLQFGLIAGMDAGRSITYLAADTTASVCLTATSGDAVVRLSGAQNFRFDRMQFIASGSCTTALTVCGGASNIRLTNCTIRGADSVNSNTVGVRIQTDGCSGITLDRVSVSGAFTGISFQGGAVLLPGLDNTIRYCTISNARCGISVSRQTNCLLFKNDIQPGSASTLAAACYGIYAASLGTGGSVRIHSNRIHDFADSSNSVTNRAAGIYAAPGSGNVEIFNNFIYGFKRVQQLKLSGIYLSGGSNRVYHNSVLLDDVPANNEIAAILISSGNDNELKNNIIVSREDGTANYGVLLNSGSVVCDGNDLFGFSVAFKPGRINGITYSTFSEWQAAGYDVHGLSADPYFVSDSDLHIIDTMTVVNGAGVVCASVITDIDNELRGTPPDVGADEYTIQPPPDKPRNLTILAQTGSLLLRWNSVERAASYHIYTDSSPELSPTIENLWASTSDTFYVIPLHPDTAAIQFFIITADTRPISTIQSHGDGFNDPEKATLPKVEKMKQ